MARLFHESPDGRRGFTIIELLIVLSILTTLTLGALFGVRAVREKSDLNRAASSTLELLRGARERTIAAENDTVWGLHISGSDVRLFQGSAYLGVDEDMATMPGTVTATWALTGGGDDVVFNRIEGTTMTDGTVTLTHDNGDSETVTILSSGEIALIGGLPLELGTRVTDTRHAHLTIPYDLSTATTLELTFIDPPNPDVIESITIADFVSGGAFIWDETIDVNGDLERIRLVTHTLAATTILSVRRDRMVNDNAVQMRVDGALIASYSDVGSITPGVGVIVDVQ